MNQNKLIENILKASKTISLSKGTADYIVTNSAVASVLERLKVRSERKRKLKKILWNW